MTHYGYRDGYLGKMKMNINNDPFYESEYERGRGDCMRIDHEIEKEKQQKLKFELMEGLRKQKEREMESLRYAIERDMKFKF